jgi:hypothetical protein
MKKRILFPEGDRNIVRTLASVRASMALVASSNKMIGLSMVEKLFDPWNGGPDNQQFAILLQYP